MSQGRNGQHATGPVACNGEAAVAALDQASDAVERLEALTGENEALWRDLLRCYEQLSLVFEITEHIANLHDPRHVENALLRRYATMLGAGAVLIERIGDVTAVSLSAEPGSELRIDAATAGRALSEEIQSVRKRNRAQVLSRCTLPSRRLQNTRAKENGSGVDDRVCHVLLAPLRQLRQDPAVVIAVRSSEQSPFDSGDMLASESVLGYGGHILSNMLMVRHLQKMAFETVRALVSAIDQKDNYTCGHAERVGWLAVLTGRALGLGDEDLQQIEWAGLLHDVGKIGVSEAILNKPGKLTDEEFEIMKRHPRMSYEVLKPVASLGAILGAVLHHHENHDGSGYPDKLAGEQIPLQARIIHVVDIFDALTSTRSYRRGFDLHKAFGILESDSGRVTDPRVTRAFIDAFKRYMREQPKDFATRFGHLAELEAEQHAEAAPSREGRPGS
jgi:HD-GYP domain-containing protein (c-di-GMP phosphodiesterase class II)